MMNSMQPDSPVNETRESAERPALKGGRPVIPDLPAPRVRWGDEERRELASKLNISSLAVPGRMDLQRASTIRSGENA